jgi:hypothetical protein
MSKTVNTYGQFTPFTTSKEYEEYPKFEWSDMDWIAYTVLKRIEKENYEIKTSLSDICEMVYGDIDYCEYTDVFNGKGGVDWVGVVDICDKIDCIIGEHCGLKEFDYEC